MLIMIRIIFWPKEVERQTRHGDSRMSAQIGQGSWHRKTAMHVEAGTGSEQ